MVCLVHMDSLDVCDELNHPVHCAVSTIPVNLSNDGLNYLKWLMGVFSDGTGPLRWMWFMVLLTGLRLYFFPYRLLNWYWLSFGEKVNGSSHLSV